MTRASVLAFVLLASLAAGGIAHGDSWISSVRKKVKEPAPPAPAKEDDDHCDSDKKPIWSFSAPDFDDEDDSLSSFGFQVGAMTISSPYWLPIAIVGDQYDATAEFAPAPYANDRSGRIDLTPDEETRSFAARLTTEVGSNLGDTVSLGGRLQLDTSFRLCLDTEFFTRIEDRPTGQETIDTGDVNVVFRFAQSERAEFYSGVGMNYLLDNVGGDEFGFNFTYGADFYPVKPIVLSSSFDLGRLGGATLFHGRATMGAVIHRVELYTGYDVYSIGGASLHSWITGLRFYF